MAKAMTIAEKKARVVNILNKMFDQLDAVTYDEINLEIPAVDPVALVALEKEHPEVGLVATLDGCSVLSIIATITEILVGDRLAFKVVDGTNIIQGVTWRSLCKSSIDGQPYGQAAPPAIDRPDWRGLQLDEIAQPGEPVFVLRAQDMAAPIAVEAWAKVAQSFGASDDIVKSAMAQAQRMRDWPIKKVPDLPAHQVDGANYVDNGQPVT